MANRYRLQSQLGRGGMGTVWLADDELLGRAVAVKEVGFPAELTDEQRAVLRERTYREARAAARLNHPSAVTVFDVVAEDGWPYIVMELIEARTLAKVIRDDGPLTPREAARIGLSVLSALEAAHAIGMVHRDVKPANIMLRPDGRVTLTDFGIATSTGESSITSSGLLLGSPSYMAPERARGEEPGPPCDLWSLGATLYTAVEGKPPYEREQPFLTLAAIVAGDPPPFERAGAFSSVLQGLLAHDPADRPTAAQVRQQLLDIMQSEDGALGTAVPDPHIDDTSSRHTMAIARAKLAAGPTPDLVADTQEVTPVAKAETRSEPQAAAPPEPDAIPDVQPVPVPDPDPVPQPDPVPDPEPVPVPEPEPVPTPEPEPVPAPVPMRGSEPRPEPESDQRQAPPAPVPPPAAARPPRRRSKVGALVLVTLAVLALAGVLALQGQLGDPDSAAENPTAGVAANAPTPATDGQPQNEAPDEGAAGGGGSGDGADAEEGSANGSGNDGAQDTDPQPAAQDVPAGFTRYTADAGWSVAIPDGWTVNQRDETMIDLENPEGGYLRVDWTTTPQADAYDNWLEYEQAYASQHDGYERIRLEDMEFRDWPDAADWEYRWREGGATLHAINRNFIITEGELAFALNFVTREGDWDPELFEVFAETFQPPPDGVV